ncbi:DUF2637 domain-containing protein [Actinoplanes sp. NPDC049596]|uniref:DUF2637 domain-containing protein n=1 Tax=unclassified Actinoplanes TaxID=2626549 RepID=UPI00341874B5
MILEHLRRVRWAVRATLLLGVAASVVANVLHALDNPISQAIAAWPPLALLLTVELISRVPVHRRWLAAARFLSTAIIAGIAAWVSYWHMVGVAARYGETGASPYLLPLSVDGLIVVASICLVELGGRISTLERATDPATSSPAPASPTAGPAASPAPASPTAGPAAPAMTITRLPDISDTHDESDPAAALPGLIPAPTRNAGTGAGSRAATAAALAEVAAALPRATDNPPFTPTVTRQGRPAGNAPRPATGAPRSAAETPRPSASVPRSAAEASRPVGAGRAVPAQRTRPETTTVSAEKPPRARRTPAETVALAQQIRTARPDLSEADLAAELGISLSRWRTIRRETGDPTLAV